MTDLDRDLISTDEGDRPSDPITVLLRDALKETPRPKRSLLPGVQQRIRIQTKGRYYRDRFSRSENPVSFLLMAILLVLILATALFLVVMPLVDAPQKTDLKSPPVDVFGQESP